MTTHTAKTKAVLQYKGKNKQMKKVKQLSSSSDLSGYQFGNLLVVNLDHVYRKQYASCTRKLYFWNCRCKCGNTILVESSYLLRSKAERLMCAECINKRVVDSKNDTHTECVRSATKQDRSDRRYWLWIGLKTKCYRRNSSSYHLYGARGIKMAFPWLDFRVFRQWLEDHGWTDPTVRSHYLARRNEDNDYSPTNCYLVKLGPCQYKPYR